MPPWPFNWHRADTWIGSVWAAAELLHCVLLTGLAVVPMLGLRCHMLK